MKKQQQREPVRSKANQQLQQRLITRETYQLVNSKKFGTAASRNERQFAKKMRCLHTEQAKTLAKLRDEIHEVKTHHKLLREVNETTRDPRTAEEKAGDFLEDIMINGGELRKLNLGKSCDFERSPRLVIRKHPSEGIRSGKPRTGVSESTKRPKSMINGPTLKDGKLRAGRTAVDSSVPLGHKPTFLYGLLDMKVKRDASLAKKYNYNLENGEKLPREKCSLTMPELTQNARVPNIVSNTRVNYLELAGNTAGKKNRRTIGGGNRLRAESLTKPTGDGDHSKASHRIHVRPIQRIVNDEKLNDDTRQKLRVRYQPGYYVTKPGIEDDATSSSDDAIVEEDQATSSTEDWGTMLSKCRYLRKPKGYGTPEMTIEAIFQ